MSVLILGAFLLMMIHNVVPHAHHDHDKSEAIFEHTSHHHNSHDHSHKKPDAQNSEQDEDDGFLLLFLTYHLHTSPSNDFISSAKREVIVIDENSFCSHSLFHSSSFNLKIALWRTGKYYISHFRLYENVFLSKGSSRAPPYLG